MLCLSYAESFKDVVDSIDSHNATEILRKTSLALKETAKIQGAWSDPSIRLAFRNFPKDSLKNDETPMTGVEVGISQKIPLTTKYRNFKKSFEMLSLSKSLEAEDKKRQLIQHLWEILIEDRKLKEEDGIFKENLQWISKMLEISQKLYANGTLSGQGLLDIQIRKAEVEAVLEQKTYEKKIQKDRLGYLSDVASRIDTTTIPWRILEKRETHAKDKRRPILESLLQKAQYELTASKQSYIPDINVSLGYVKRSNIDKKGDFLQASLSMDIPLTGKASANYARAVYKQHSIKSRLNDYDRKRNRESRKLSNTIAKLLGKLKILENRIIRFAENSRKITSKSYELGQSNYVELLQAELKLQQFLLTRVEIRAELAYTRAALKYLLGEALHD